VETKVHVKCFKETGHAVLVAQLLQSSHSNQIQLDLELSSAEIATRRQWPTEVISAVETAEDTDDSNRKEKTLFFKKSGVFSFT
jgi:hypothetical protein